LIDTATVLILVGAGILALLSLVLFEVFREQRRAREQVQVLDHFRNDLTNFVRLTQKITGTDFQRSIHTLLAEIIAQGYSQGVVLIAVSEHGHLEQRAAAFATDAEPWEPLAEPGVQQALADRQHVVDRAGGRIFIPVQDNEEIVGILVARGLRSEDLIERGDLPYLEAAAHLTGLCLAAHRALQKQVTLSTTDGLTGLTNHRHFQQLLGVSLAQTYLQGNPLAVILFDIDRFKSVNDTYGHLFGDLVLRELGNIARRVLPPNAVIARYGGEEFAVLLDGYTLDAAVRAAEKLRAAVEENPVLDYASGNRIAITISLGVALYELGMGKPRLIQKADDALYASKKGGRNRVTAAPTEDEGKAVASRQ
jgi:diguanylate cyclase (GGDEF)-like protein